MTTNSPYTIHALVRLLKSSTDPPSTPGPSKIEIACLAWTDPAFRAANKGEVIGEWMFTLLGQARKTKREKDGNSFDPIADSRYWTLLAAVLTTPTPTAARPIKTWLLPLLSRFQLDTIVIELLALRSPKVLAPARATLAVLWPLAEKKIAADALAEGLSAVSNACTDWESVDDDLAWICSAVVAAYKNALANTGNRKKLYNYFLDAHLSSWLSAVSRAGPPSTKQLQDSIYAAGTDTLFSLDALKQPLDTLFDALSSSISSPLPVLPNLCVSFVSATHKHRTTLFVTSVVSGREEVRKKGLEFVGRCWILIRGSATPREHFEADKWRSAVGVLRIVEKERLFVPHPIRVTHATSMGESVGEPTLTEVREKAVEKLENVDASSKDHQEQAVFSIQLLDVLVQIDYDFVGFVLERVLAALINIPPSPSHSVTAASSEFLAHALEYHTKTRTVHTYALTLLNAVAGPHSPASSRSMASAFPLAYHLPAVARALRTSLTLTQITPLVTEVIQAVEGTFRTFKNTNEEESTKKHKVAEDTIDTRPIGASSAVPARTFSYRCRIAGTILSSLPASAYAKDEENSLEHIWSGVGKLGWTVVWDCLREKIGEAQDTSKGKNGKKRKYVETDLSFMVHAHVVASAALRFLYDIRAQVRSPLGDRDWLGEAQVETLLNVARDEASDPELVLEIVRTLLWHVWYTHDYESQQRIETQPVFTLILDIITARPLFNLKWSGISAARNNLGLVVLYILTERWIDIFDAFASTENLQRLVSSLLVVSLDPSNNDTRDNSEETHLEQDHAVITLRDILLRLFRNAQFWELHNIRGVLLSSVLTLTAPLSPYCFPIAGTEPLSPISVIELTPIELTPICNVYNLLHYVPPEYFTRPVRTELMKRAMAADVQICMTLEGAKGRRTKAKGRGGDKSDSGQRKSHREEESDGRVQTEEVQKWSHRLMIVRAFLHRMKQFAGAPSHSTSLTFVNHLLSPPSSLIPSEALTSVTLDLVHSHVLSLLRSQELEAAVSASSIISTLVTARPFSQPKSQETWAQRIVRSSVLRLVECTTNDFDAAGLSEQVRRALKTIHEALESALLPHAERLAESDTRELDQLLSSEHIHAWSRMLSLRRWLGIDSHVAVIALKLAASTIRSENTVGLGSETCSSILGLLFEELWCMPDASHRIHLDVLVCFYAVNGGDRGSRIERVTDAYLAQASKKMSVEDFSYFLHVLEEGIEGGGLRTGHRERLVHLGQVMLHDAPQGTLKIIQNFGTRCFNLFADREDIYQGSSCVKSQCLEFIARHCSDRPAAVRSVDLGSIWTLLNKILSGSSEHDATTTFPVFQHIITIIGALVRLRRDLVVHTLPHLSLVLRQLVMLTRKVRPQLGAKQTKIVTDTFPPWLSASEPLSTDEARALARLLVSLTTKTVPRTHAHASVEPHKAESLAKPFAKHASYVLVAYVDAFNDPLCIINAEIRTDLEPGLFALCEMVGEHSRDALMVSALDSGGKTIMKSLWREYEKQRYVGKG